MTTDDAWAPRCGICKALLPEDDPTAEQHRCGTGAAFDPDELQRWLDLAYPAGDRDERFHIGVLPASGEWYGVAVPRDQVVRRIGAENRAAPSGIYLGGCTYKPEAGNGRKRDDTAWFYGVWSDLDIAGPGHKHDPAKYDGRTLPPDEDAARAIIGKAGLPEPTAWVHSGGGLYAWWLLNHPAPAQDRAQLVKDWQAALARGAEQLGHHYGTAVSDIARVLRAPGSLNRKVPDQPRSCRILAAAGPRYEVESLVEFADAVKPAEKPRQPGAGAAGDPFTGPGEQRHHQHEDTPLNAFEKATDWAEILEPAGWTLHHTDATTRYWERPGGSTTGGHSATTGHAGDRDRLYVFSDETGLPVQTPLTKPFVYAHYQFGADMSAAAQYLYERGYGPRRDKQRATTEDRDGGRPEPEPAADVDAAAEEAFWKARPAHGVIRQLAQARLVSPWAVLGVVLARIVAAAPPWWVLPKTTAGEGSLNLFVGLVGRASDGKGGACAVGTEAVDLGLHARPMTPLGTGQGISHAYMKWEEVAKGEPKPTAPTMYCHTRIFRVDEIDQLTAHANQTAATILPTLRQAWMGETLGHFYADASRRMIVPEHQYRLCLIAGIQPERAGPLIGDAGGGTPQRFLWLPAADPDMPDREPEAPYPVLWQPPQLSGPKRVLAVCGTAVAAVKAARRARMREEVSDELDGHLLFCRLKVGAALALLDGRCEVGEEDWALAGVVISRSQATRATVTTALQAVAARTNRSRALADAERAAVVAESEEERRIRRVTRLVRRRLADAHPERVTAGKLQNKITSADRDYFGAAVERLIASGDIDEQEGREGASYGLVTV